MTHSLPINHVSTWLYLLIFCHYGRSTLPLRPILMVYLRSWLNSTGSWRGMSSGSAGKYGKMLFQKSWRWQMQNKMPILWPFAAKSAPRVHNKFTPIHIISASFIGLLSFRFKVYSGYIGHLLFTP